MAAIANLVLDLIATVAAAPDGVIHCRAVHLKSSLMAVIVEPIPSPAAAAPKKAGWRQAHTTRQRSQPRFKECLSFVEAPHAAPL
jgi:hypothetical protein